MPRSFRNQSSSFPSKVRKRVKRGFRQRLGSFLFGKKATDFSVFKTKKLLKSRSEQIRRLSGGD